MAKKIVLNGTEVLGAGPLTNGGEPVEGRFVLGTFDENHELFLFEFGVHQAKSVVANLQKWIALYDKEA